jgi:hypothetical protein
VLWVGVSGLHPQEEMAMAKMKGCMVRMNEASVVDLEMRRQGLLKRD